MHIRENFIYLYEIKFKLKYEFSFAQNQIDFKFKCKELITIWYYAVGIMAFLKGAFCTDYRILGLRYLSSAEKNSLIWKEDLTMIYSFYDSNGIDWIRYGTILYILECYTVIRSHP